MYSSSKHWMNVIYLIVLSLLSSFLIVSSQVIFKIALSDVDLFQVTSVLTLVHNPASYICVIAFVFGNVLWWMIVGKYDFSIAYPLVSFNYVFASIYSISLFHEKFTQNTLIGIVLIMIGVILVAGNKTSRRERPEQVSYKE